MIAGSMIELYLKRCVIWTMSAAAGVGLMIACGPPQPPAESAASRAIAVGVEPAFTGSISVTRTYAAIVGARDRVDVVPLATGRVEELPVNIGAEVRKGQVIAELSHGALDAQLQQAEATLRDAHATLASAQAAAKPNQTKAQARLAASRAKLDQLLNPSASDLQSAESAVARAQSNLGRTNARLDQLRNPTAATLAEAQAKVAEAQSALSLAQAQVDQAILTETAAAALTEYNVDAAPDSLDAALANLHLLKNPSPADFAVLEAEAAIAARTRALGDAPRSRQPSEVAAGLWGIILIARQGIQSNTATLLNPALSSGLTPQAKANARQVVATSQEIISTLLTEIISNTLIPEDIRAALWVESKTLAALEEAGAKLAELQGPAPNTIALAKYDVDESQASLDAALAALSSLKNPNPADLATAEAEVVIAEQTLELNQGPHIRQTIEAAQVQVDRAQAQVNLVNQQLAELQLRAPFDGFVTQIWLSPGALASPGSRTPVATVVSKDLVLTSLVEETDIGSLHTGQGATFTSPVLPGQRLDLQILRIARAGDENDHSFSVQMRPMDQTVDLKPGMSGQVSILTRRDNVVLMPKEAVLRQGGQSAVFMVQDGKARLRPVGVGLIDDQSMEIRNGIQPGDQVVVYGQNLLQEGDPVTVEGSSNR